MKSKQTICLAGLLVALLSGCSSPRHSETNEMTQMLNEQMKPLRAQMVAQGATSEQLREFDRQMAALKKSMKQVGQQLNAIEAASGQ
jgi:uncharacterized lipoprotein